MRLLKLFLIVTVVNGCASLTQDSDPTKDWSARQLYSEAKAALNDGGYEKAIDHFETLEARYPFGPYAEQAQLEVAYAYYKSGDADSAVAAADRFIKLYPRHRNVEYVYYLKGLIHFHHGSDTLDRYLRQDIAERDPTKLRQAFAAFSELLNRFPTGKYAADARQRMVFLRNNLARYELRVADYYMRRKAYVAALTRAQYVLEHYQNTPSAADALEVVAAAYRKLGLNDLAADAERVRKLNQNKPEVPES